MIKKIFLLLIFWGSILAQNLSTSKFFDSYENYKEASIISKFVKHSEIEKLIKKIGEQGLFSVQVAGESFEGRKIYLLKIGTGDIKVFAWSQMHGDESTATMALFDVFNFLVANDEFNDFRKELFSKVTLYFVPLVNPDGAERWQRRNALNIDLNRDALRLQCPESQILKNIRDTLNPMFGFNLHDQDVWLSVGDTKKNAAISFLAPAFNYEKDIDDVRERTMKLISCLFEELSKFIPGHIAKYNDDFEPRAFGDNMIKWGTSSVLIETGGWKNDFEKQFLRKINFVALLSAFQFISNECYKTSNIQTYFDIPENERRAFDLLLRNLKMESNGKEILVDIGVNRSETILKSKDKIYFIGKVQDIGDLTPFFGYDELDCDTMKIFLGKTYPDEINSIEELQKMDFKKLYEQGYTSVKVKNYETKECCTNFPINILKKEEERNNNEIRIGSPANFVIKDKDKIRYVVINGYVFDILKQEGEIYNGIIE